MTRHYTDEIKDHEGYAYPEVLYEAVIARLTGTGDTIEDALYASGYHLDEFDEANIETIRVDLDEFFGFEFHSKREVWDHR